MFHDLLFGLSLVAQPANLIALLGGLFLGVAIGALPGIGSTQGAALLIPFTFVLSPIQSLLLLGAVYSGSVYGGSIAAILLRIPGSYESIATTLDGYELARQGKAGKALGTAIAASAIGGTFSVLVLIFLAPQLARIALAFGPPEYFALAVLGLTVIATAEGKSLLKALVSGLAGLFFATVGIDSITGFTRFTFDASVLSNGVSFIPAIIGMFAVSEVYRRLEAEHLETEKVAAGKTRIAAELPKREELRSMAGLIARSSVLGTIIGILPGVGGTVASLLGYSEAKRLSKHPEKFGTGILEGVAAPEAANNAACGGAMVPLLSLGIPGSAVTAVMIGAFMIHGLRPGPFLFVHNKDLVYSIFVGMLLVNILMVPAGFLGVRLFVKLLDVPYRVLAPTILVLCTVGSFAINNSFGDVWIMLAFSVIGYFMSKLGFPFTPLILGMVLGPIAESSLRRGILITPGGFSGVVFRPISGSILLLSVILLLVPVLRYIRTRKEVRQAA